MSVKESFWSTLSKPFFAMAPMADVTDAAFRHIVAKYSKQNGLAQKAPLGKVLGSPRPAAGPDHFLKDFSAPNRFVVWTEQVSCDGLCHAKGREKLMSDLRFTDLERPILLQLFGSKPGNFVKCVELAKELGFDGVDINMGCPDRSINRQKAGADLINNPALAREIIRAAKESAGEMPVSVKTRIGYNNIITEKWIGELMQENPAAITIHGRTKKEMSKVPAHWDEIGKAAELIHKHNPDIKVIGNGDVRSLEEGREKAEKYRLDGIMIGRGVFGNPWLFNPDVKKDDLSPKEITRVMLEHTRLFEELYTGIKSFNVMKKHFGSYVAGFPQAKELKTALMLTNSTDEAEGVLKDYGIC